jgi:hypothetical protein
VPDVGVVERTTAEREGAQEVGAQRRDPLDEQRAPVVSDQVDGRADRLDLGDEPRRPGARA